MKMSDVYISPRAYCKTILHGVKYPHCAINGLLLAKQKKGEGKSANLYIEDAIPLFHICLHVSPMAEIALNLVDHYCSTKGLVIAGYYLANENINDLSTDRPAHRIADKIAENLGNAILVVIDNKALSLTSGSPLRISQFIDGKWKAKDKANIIYEDEADKPNLMVNLIKEDQHKNLIDFDNHLDDIALDWLNKKLNKIIEESVQRHKSS
ncbi:ER membrane protein complex subunit 8-like [Prorops nasuta]|uniref:ER membrane protein complex subunit 8-like n=1 Tax=Prorops nasuta TaxID=863751 RepID=UPI0034CD4AD0